MSKHVTSEHIRHICIDWLNRSRPAQTSTEALFAHVRSIYLGIPQNDYTRELDYLQLKGLITLTDTLPQRVSLTAAGVELAEGIPDAKPSAPPRTLSPTPWQRAVTARISRDRHGHPLVTLISAPFNDFEVSPGALRQLAQHLVSIAETAHKAPMGKTFRPILIEIGSEASQPGAAT